MQKPKARIFDSAFTPFSKSASLREENKDVHPTHFEWEATEGDDAKWLTDGNLKYITENEIAWLIEPRHLRPENYAYADDPIRRAYMKYILTYDKELLDKYPDKALFYPFGGSSIAFDRWGLYEKTKDICMFVSNRKQTEGHKLRHKIAEEFGDRIDLYGAGVGKPVDSKFEVLKDYRFEIVVESGNIDHYWTEKIVDPISIGTFPVYCGCPSIGDWFDIRGMWRFEEIDELQEFFSYKEDLWRSPHRDEFQQRMIAMATKCRVCEDWIYTHYPFLFEANND